jgi:hypothetical protein
MEFAKSHDMHPLLLGMIWTFSAGGKLFAYQSGVLIVGYSYGYFAARDLVRMGACLRRSGACLQTGQVDRRSAGATR